MTTTLGPASEEEVVLRRLFDVSQRFRLNSSHLSGEALSHWLLRLQSLFTETGRTVPVVIDLQGAKMRIGRVPKVDFLPEVVRLVLQAAPDGIPIPHPELFEALRPGETLTLNDARVRLVVESAEKSSCRCRVVHQGPLESHKGINRPDHPIPLKGLLPGDREAVEVGHRFPFVEFAFSFVHTGAEATLLRDVTGRRLIAKVERPEAMQHLDDIAALFDEIWLCRGDLGAQAGLARLGRLQHDFTNRMPEFGVPCHLAGQVLEHMTHHPEPTRTEVVHLYDVERNGFGGIVLSDETAVGAYPIAVADYLAGLSGSA